MGRPPIRSAWRCGNGAPPLCETRRRAISRLTASSTSRARVSLVGGPDSATVALRASSTNARGKWKVARTLRGEGVATTGPGRRAAALQPPKTVSSGSPPKLGRCLLMCGAPVFTLTQLRGDSPVVRGAGARGRVGRDRLFEARRFREPNILPDGAVEDQVGKPLSESPDDRPRELGPEIDAARHDADE